MKTKKIFSLLIILIFVFKLNAQNTDQTSDDQLDFEIPEVEHLDEGISGNFNYTNIGDQHLIGARFTPELSFGKIGFGLEVPLMVDLQTGQLRIDEFKDGVGPLRILRYFRYGVKKRDPIYFRIGELRDAQLGFGMLISDYKNSISFEKRKLGFDFDLIFKDKFGLEMIYSDMDVTSFNLFGVRPYIKPFATTGIPIIKSFEIGLGYVTDHDKTILTENDSIIYRTNYLLNKGINSFSADMGFWILNMNFLRWNVYAQAGYMAKVKSDSLTNYINLSTDEHLKNYKDGMGWSVGSDFNFKFLGNLLKINYRVERFWHSNYYIPRFYNFAYELNKDASIMQLANSHADQGMYFKIGASVLDKVIIHANIIFPDKIDNTHPAKMYFGMDLSGIIDKLTLYTSMYQSDITDLSKIGKFNDNTLFETLVAWQIYKVPVIGLQFTTGVDFKWTYAFVANQNFEATHYISPFFKINIPLNNDNNQKGTK